MLITSADSCSHGSSRITTTINVSGSNIYIYLRCEDNCNAALSATSFIEGDTASSAPFLVTLPNSALEEDPHPINMINATSTLNIARLITGQGKKEFAPMIPLLASDLLACCQNNSVLCALGRSVHSEYLLRSLCFYAMKHDPSFSKENSENIKIISQTLQTQAFSVNRYSSTDIKPIVLDAMRLTRCPDGI